MRVFVVLENADPATPLVGCEDVGPWLTFVVRESLGSVRIVAVLEDFDPAITFVELEDVDSTTIFVAFEDDGSVTTFVTFENIASVTASAALDDAGSAVTSATIGSVAAVVLFEDIGLATAFVAYGVLDDGRGEEIDDTGLFMKLAADKLEGRTGRRTGSRAGSCGSLCLAGDFIATRFCTLGCVAERETVGLMDRLVEGVGRVVARARFTSRDRDGIVGRD